MKEEKLAWEVFWLRLMEKGGRLLWVGWNHKSTEVGGNAISLWCLSLSSMKALIYLPDQQNLVFSLHLPAFSYHSSFSLTVRLPSLFHFPLPYALLTPFPCPAEAQKIHTFLPFLDLCCSSALLRLVIGHEDILSGSGQWDSICLAYWVHWDLNKDRIYICAGTLRFW